MIQFDLGDTSIPDDIVEELVDRAYAYVRGRLTKKVREQLES